MLKSMSLIFKVQVTNELETIQTVIKLSNVARKDGLLQLEEMANSMDDAFMKKGLLLIVDGTAPGLPHMAIALVTTLYGSMLANWICTPVANKLKANNSAEMRQKEILVEGLLSIQAGENPRGIEGTRKKQKQEEQAPGSPAWMATFSDLMNLLLCFFVLLFSMSNIDEAKWEELVNSLSNRLSLSSGGRPSIGEGQLINTGMSQLNNLDEYLNDMGQKSEQTGEDVMDLHEKIEQANREETEEMYDDISDLSSEYDLDKYLDIGVDETGGRYITIDISGSFLYTTGSAQMENSALPVFSRVGDILKLGIRTMFQFQKGADTAATVNFQVPVQILQRSILWRIRGLTRH